MAPTRADTPTTASVTSLNIAPSEQIQVIVARPAEAAVAPTRADTPTTASVTSLNIAPSEQIQVIVARPVVKRLTVAARTFRILCAGTAAQMRRAAVRPSRAVRGQVGLYRGAHAPAGPHTMQLHAAGEYAIMMTRPRMSHTRLPSPPTQKRCLTLTSAFGMSAVFGITTSSRELR